MHARKGVLRTFLAIAVLFSPGVIQADDADALRARHAALREQLASNPFGRPLHVLSKEEPGEHQGEVFAILDKPYAQVGPALRRLGHWCDILILQANVKHCEASTADASLRFFVARRPTDSVDRAYGVDFRYEVTEPQADYLRVALTSANGPADTSDYRIVLKAAALDGRRTFLHMSYSYRLGFSARVAMKTYLATSGRDKVGFSIVDRLPDGRPVYVDGVRGIVERSTMRYYLAIEAFLDALDAPSARRLDTRLRNFHAALERHPRQLRELRLEEYLQLKRGDAARLAQAPQQ